MAKMTVIYKTPKDKEFFDKHYFNVHVPLAKQLTGLIKYEINDGPRTFRYLSHCEFILDSLATIKEAFNSEIGRQCAADRKILAPDNKDVQIYLYDTKDT